MKRFLFVFLIIFIQLKVNCQSDKTEIFVLGTSHLNQIDGFEAEMLSSLIGELQEKDFGAICIERMPTQLLYDIEARKDSAFAGVLKAFGGERLDLSKKAQREFGFSFLQAKKEIDQILQKHSLLREDREKLIHLFFCTGEIASAALQYQYLGNEIDAETDFEFQINEKLKACINYSNEIYSVALPLAKSEGIQRLEYIDNFQDEAILLDEFPKFIDDYVANQDLFLEISKKPVYLKADSLQKAAIEKGDLLDFFRYLNSEEYQKGDYEAQWAIWLQTNFESGSDLSRYALWEMRNLQIAAQIMRVTADYPGKRILVIIGASHKSFLEKYLVKVLSVELLTFE